MADWNNLDDDLIEEEETEEIGELETKESVDNTNDDNWVYFENLVSSSSTIVKVYESEISLEEIAIVKDSVGAHIIIIHDDKAFSQVEEMSEKIVQDEEGDNYCVIFISEDIVKEIEERISIRLDYQNILKKEDIEHETSTLLAG